MRFPFACELDGGKRINDDDDGGVRSGDGAGAEIGWVNLSCRHYDPWIVSCFVKV